MGLIFKDIHDEQQESLMKTIHIGNTWEFRYFKAKALFWGVVSTTTGITITAVIDYGIYKFTVYSGLIGWLLA